MIRSRDVAFQENEFPFKTNLDTSNSNCDSQKPITVVLPEGEDSDNDTDLEIIKSTVEKSHALPVTKRRKYDDLSINMNWQPQQNDANTRNTRISMRRIADMANMAISGISPTNQAVYDFAYLGEEGPRTYEGALKSEHAESWKEAFRSEMDSLNKHQVFDRAINSTEAAELSNTGKIVDGRFVLTIKYHVDGSLDKFKARLIARGFTQNPEDYGEIMAPVVDAVAIRYSLGYAAKHDLEIAVLDVPTAYLGATLNEEVYLKLPGAD